MLGRTVFIAMFFGIGFVVAAALHGGVDFAKRMVGGNMSAREEGIIIAAGVITILIALGADRIVLWLYFHTICGPSFLPTYSYCY